MGRCQLTLPEPARSSSNKILSLLLGLLPGSRGMTLRFVWLALSVSLSCCLHSSLALSNVPPMSPPPLPSDSSLWPVSHLHLSGQISQVPSVLGCFSLHLWHACLQMSGNAPLACPRYPSLCLGLPFTLLSVFACLCPHLSLALCSSECLSVTHLGQGRGRFLFPGPQSTCLLVQGYSCSEPIRLQKPPPCLPSPPSSPHPHIPASL